MKAVLRTRAKLRTWASSCRGCMDESEDNIVVDLSAMRRVQVWDFESGVNGRSYLLENLPAKGAIAAGLWLLEELLMSGWKSMLGTFVVRDNIDCLRCGSLSL